MINKIMGMGLVGLCYFLIGSSYPIAQEAVNAIPTWTFMSATFFIGFISQVPFTLMVDKTNWFKISGREWATVAALTLVGNVLYTAFLLYGMSETTATSAAVISSATPAIVLMLSVLFLKEKIRLNMVISIILAIVAVVMMTIPAGSAGSSGNSFTGLVLLSLSTLSSALFVIIAKKYTSVLSPWTLSAAICLLGFIFTLPLSLMELRDYNLLSVTPKQFITMLYYGVFVWALPIYFCMVGIRYIPAAAAGMLFAFIPVASAITSVLFFDAKLRVIDVISIFIVILSVIISEVNLRTRQKIAQLDI